MSKYLTVPVIKITPPRLRLNQKAKTGTLATLTAIKNLFGPAGENWIKGAEHRTINDIHKYCLIGAVKEVNGAYEGIAHAAISLAIMHLFPDLVTYGEYSPYGVEEAVTDEGTVTEFNDRRRSGKKKGTSWADTKRVLAKARQLVQAA